MRYNHERVARSVQKEMVIHYIKVISWHLPEGLKKIIISVRMADYLTKFEPGTSHLQVR
jgi:hypothetical protein